MPKIKKHRQQCRYKFSVCHSCHGIFENRQKLFEHRRKYGLDSNETEEIKIYECCDKLFYDLRTFNKHKRIHSKPFRCLLMNKNGVLCNKQFSNKRNLEVHARSHNNDRREKCGFCKMAFFDPSTLKNHVKYMHSKVELKKYFCRVCHKKFARKHSLKKHMESHWNLDERKLFHCDECDLHFTHKSNLRRHKKRLHPIAVN